MRGTAVGAGSLAAGGASLNYSTREAEAIAPVVIAGAAVGASAVVGWTLREYEVIGSDDPASGLTADALGNQILTAGEARASNNASTFIDNENIVGSGLENTLYADGKVAAIDELNNEETQDTVQDAATTAATNHGTTVLKNFLKSWNESVNEINSFLLAADDHPDVGRLAFTPYGDDWYNGFPPGDGMDDFQIKETTTTLPDGSDFTVKQIEISLDNVGNVSYARWSPMDLTTGGAQPDELEQPETWGVIVSDNYDNRENYMVFNEWNSLYSLIDQTVTDAKDGLILWVDNVYSDVQAGELDTSELLTPRELAEMTADDEDYNQAIADLMALNVAVDLDREAEIYLPEIGATVFGSLAVSGETTLSTGTVDPSVDSHSYYLTYDVSEGLGRWDAYETGVDGGDVTFTSEPWEETEFHVETGAGETAVLMAGDFTDNGDGTYTASISDQVETSITEVNSVMYYGAVSETQYETVQLTDQFEIVEFTDSEGNTHDSSEYTQSEPQDDTNYITEEEWKAQQERYEDLIDDYEDSQGGGGFVDGLGFGGIPGEGVLVAIVGIVLVLLGQSDN